VAHQMKRGLVLEILALATHLLVRFRQQLHRLPAALAPLLPACYRALRRFQVTFGFAVTAGIVDHRAIGEGRE